MALSVVGTPASAGTGGNPGSSSLTTSFTLDAATDLLVVEIAYNNSIATPRTVSSVTWNGVALSQVSGAVSENTNDGAGVRRAVDIWYLTAPATGANNLVTTMSGASNSIVHGVIGFSGAHQTTIPAFKAASTATANPATVNTTTTSGSYVVGVVTFNTPNTGSITSNNTEAWERLEQAQNDSVVNASYDVTTSPTISWANTLTVTCALTTVEIFPASSSSPITSAWLRA